ncbi:MAG: T9SS type A sorting domain-containing protein [Flavobacteriales bacterium]|nr:T9SS type A sorting domain-containing protein [Flavobacteriales bacterium]
MGNKQCIASLPLVLSLALPSISVAQSDTPCGAPALTVHTGACEFDVFSTAGFTYQSDAANGGVPNCAFPGSPDVWFTVTVPASGALAITTEAGTISDGGIAIYRGPCNSLTFLECDDDAAVGMMCVVDRSDLVPGETLYVRFWRAANPGTGTFGICAVESHSDCEVAVPVCHTFHVDGNAYGPGSTMDEFANYCDIAEFQSQWFYFHFLTGGTFEFKIFPDLAMGIYPDYDWLLFQGDISTFCATHTSDTPPLMCNGSSSTGLEGETGLDATGVSSSVPAGPGNPFCPILNVNAGDYYWLFVNNFSTTSTGFTLEVGGTAQLDCDIVLGSSHAIMEAATSLEVYPVPACDQITIRANDVRVARIRVFDASGRSCLDLPMIGSVAIPAASLASGSYVVQTSDMRGGVLQRARIIIE